MTRDDVIRMAREAGFRAGHIESYNSDPMPFIGPRSATNCMPEVVRFAAIVAAAEREACAKVCEEMSGSDYLPHQCAAAIRARGKPDAH